MARRSLNPFEAQALAGSALEVAHTHNTKVALNEAYGVVGTPPRRPRQPQPDPLPTSERIERAARKSIINTATRGDEEKQAIATPWAFIHALEQRFGVPVDFDLAADPNTAKASAWFGEQRNQPFVDSLESDWSTLVTIANRDEPGVTRFAPAKLAYLNPPFAHIKPWAHKVVDCRWLTRWTVMLVPASYSTDWFIELRGKVVQDAIPRIQFESASHLYPKDLSLIVAGFGMVGAGYWDWRASYVQYCTARSIEPDPVHLKGVARFPVEPVLPDFNWTPDPFYKPQAP